MNDHKPVTIVSTETVSLRTNNSATYSLPSLPSSSAACTSRSTCLMRRAILRSAPGSIPVQQNIDSNARKHKCVPEVPAPISLRLRPHFRALMRFKPTGKQSCLRKMPTKPSSSCASARLCHQLKTVPLLVLASSYAESREISKWLNSRHGIDELLNKSTYLDIPTTSPYRRVFQRTEATGLHRDRSRCTQSRNSGVALKPVFSFLKISLFYAQVVGPLFSQVAFCAAAKPL